MRSTNLGDVFGTHNTFYVKLKLFAMHMRFNSSYSFNLQ